MSPHFPKRVPEQPGMLQGHGRSLDKQSSAPRSRNALERLLLNLLSEKITFGIVDMRPSRKEMSYQHIRQDSAGPRGSPSPLSSHREGIFPPKCRSHLGPAGCPLRAQLPPGERPAHPRGPVRFRPAFPAGSPPVPLPFPRTHLRK